MFWDQSHQNTFFRYIVPLIASTQGFEIEQEDLPNQIHVCLSKTQTNAVNY